ncbi:hypothetical protein JCM19233_5564 [Vibrio astriarenae]|nr:hypothetical protein JCM19233_5564 [Vibrio sp. C7]
MERNIDERIKDITFKNKDGSVTPTLKEYLVGPKQVQAVMMAHKGKVVFETYPGMSLVTITYGCLLLKQLLAY